MKPLKYNFMNSIKDLKLFLPVYDKLTRTFYWHMNMLYCGDGHPVMIIVDAQLYFTFSIMRDILDSPIGEPVREIL